jgi:hypothetical protein
MKHSEMLMKKHNVLLSLSSLPQKILSLHGRADVAEFVLRDLSHERCLNLKKAAYFVDNPDFNCLKGVAAYCHEENQTVRDGLWDHPDEFMDKIRESAFNKKVRDLWLPSMQRVDGAQEDMIQQIGSILEIEKPSACMLDIKHGNKALFIFEKQACDEEASDELVKHGVSLLGFCPIY